MPVGKETEVLNEAVESDFPSASDVTTEMENESESDEVVDTEEEVAEVSETPETEEQETPGNDDWDGVDPTKLPPELLGQYKGMQGAFTKKMQALQDALNELQPHKDRLGLIDKAIQGDPQARETLARIAGNQQAQQQQQQQQPDNEQFYKDVPEQFEDPKHMVKYLDQRIGGFLNNWVPQVVNQMIQEQIAPLMDMRKTMVQREVTSEIDGMKSKYKDFDKHVSSIVKLKKDNPNLSMEDAYKLASWKAPTPPNKIVSKPGARPSASVPNTEGISSFEQAGAMALKMMKRKG